MGLLTFVDKLSIIAEMSRFFVAKILQIVFKNVARWLQPAASEGCACCGQVAGRQQWECCCMMDRVCCGDAWCWVKFSSAKLKMILALRLVLPWILPWMLLGGTLNLQPITGDDDLY